MDDHVIECVAEAIHEAYLEDRRADGSYDPSDPRKPAHRPWAELRDSEKAQNRDLARHNIVKLRELGFHVVPVTEVPEDDEVDISALIERLAPLEHDRWADLRHSEGYRYGPVRVDEGPDKRHPDMVAWEDLSEDSKEKDRAAVRDFPKHLARAGLRIIRHTAMP